MTIVVTGGGSGGHITPVLAVAAALKQANPSTRVVFVGQRGDGLADIPGQDPNIDAVFAVRAGKFRRYHGLGWRQAFDVKTMVLNLRDMVYILIGIGQSYRLMGQLKPDIIFTRGGFVSVPVALGGKLRGIPYVTHDSDSTPSLANRLIARWARLHAVALPAEVYPYEPSKTVMVGIPISPDYSDMTPALQARYRTELKLPATAQIIFVTGGGNGAHNLNQYVLENSSKLLQRYPDLHILHIAGRALEAALAADYDGTLTPEQRRRVQVDGFVDGMHRYSGAADVIIGRGGATNVAEWAAQSKACIIVPSPQLIWNVKNNEELVRLGAIEQLTEVQAEQEGRLARLVAELLDDAKRRAALGKQLHTLARPDAAEHLAKLLTEQVGQ